MIMDSYNKQSNANNSKPAYFIKDGYSNMDFDKVTELLKNSYWVPNIQKEEVLEGSRHSALLVGAFNMSNEQIAFARVISDKMRFAYVMDVIVNDNYRKQGIGQAMMKHILHHSDLKNVYQWLLITKDAHGVYRNVGFNPVAQANDWMEIRYERPLR